MAIVLDEPRAKACRALMADEDNLIISAGTLSEALILAAGRGVDDELNLIVNELHVSVEPVTHVSARRVAAACPR